MAPGFVQTICEHAVSFTAAKVEDEELAKLLGQLDSLAKGDLAKLNAAVSNALDDPQVRTRLDGIGLIPAAPERRSPEYLRRFINAEIEKWAKPVKASGLQAD